MPGKIVAVPGLYRRDEIDYEAINAVNQSTLKRIAKSPLHYQHRLEHELPSTVPMRLGSVAHTAILEPDRLARDYAVWNPDGKKPDFRGKDFEEFAALAVMSGKRVIKPAEIEAAHRMAAAVQRNQLARRYLARGQAEPILVWIDEATGIACKARLDWISTSVADVMAELKTAADVAPFAFESAFARNGYDVQTAFYCDGYKAATGRELYPKCIAVESSAPHDVIVYDLAEVVDVGRELYREMLATLAECRRTGLWLGQSPTSERTLRLPRWRDPAEADANTLDDLGLEVGT